jgi:hypothetical protein
MAKRVFGVVMILMGAVLLLWIGYNVFIETTPSAQGRSPFLPTLVGIALVLVGLERARGK